MRIERRHLPARVHLRADEDGTERIVGTAIVFYDGTPDTEFVLWDDRGKYDGGVKMVERIMPSAVSGRMKDDVRGLFNHDPTQVLGRSPKTLKLSRDEKGLHYSIDPGETTVAANVREHLRREDVTGSSFSFTLEPKGQRFKEEDDIHIREITKLSQLFDVGPVTYPAYEATQAGVRGASDLAEAREMFAAWELNQVKIKKRHAELDARCEEIGVD